MTTEMQTQFDAMQARIAVLTAQLAHPEPKEQKRVTAAPRPKSDKARTKAAEKARQKKFKEEAWHRRRLSSSLNRYHC